MADDDDQVGQITGAPTPGAAKPSPLPDPATDVPTRVPGTPGAGATTKPPPLPPIEVRRATPPDPPSIYQQEMDMYKKHEQMMDEEEKSLQSQTSNMNKLFQSILGEIKTDMNNRPPIPEPPKPNQLPVEDDRQKRTALLQYFAIAFPLAALMGARGGAFAAGAWGGFGKGLKALQDGENEKADSLFSRALAVDQQSARIYQQQMEHYRAILEQQHTSLSDMMDQLTAVGEMYRNQNAVTAFREKRWNDGMDRLNTMQEQQNKMAEHMNKMEQDYAPKDWSTFAELFSTKFQARYGYPYYPAWGDVHTNNLPKRVRDLLREYNYYTYYTTDRAKRFEEGNEQVQKHDYGGAADILGAPSP